MSYTQCTAKTKDLAFTPYYTSCVHFDNQECLITTSCSGGGEDLLHGRAQAMEQRLREEVYLVPSLVLFGPHLKMLSTSLLLAWEGFYDFFFSLPPFSAVVLKHGESSTLSLSICKGGDGQ